MKKNRAPSHELEQFQLRMPPGMRNQIAELAKKNRRTMTAEIIARLDQTLCIVALVGINKIGEQGQDYNYNDLNRLLDIIRQLPPNKQKALLELIGE